MSQNSKSRPAVGESFPTIALPVLGSEMRDISQSGADSDWQLELVYRGKHCPVCTDYLKELNSIVPVLAELGVDCLAVSADSESRATEQMAEVEPVFDVAFGLTVEHMQQLGLFISGPRNGINVDGAFAEPGLFVIDQDNVLQIADISNVPFARPKLDSLVKGIRFLRGLTKTYPTNGTYA